MSNLVELQRKREKRLYRAKDVQNIFMIARSTIDSWVRQGILTKKKIGNCVFFDVEEVERLAEVYL